MDFFPHGIEGDSNSEYDPMWLTAKDDNPIDASVLVLTQGSVSDKFNDYEIVCEMLDGNNDNEVKSARDRWKL